MPKVGNEEFDYTPEGIAEATDYSEATGIPISNAMERSVQTFIHGGRVQGGVTGQLGTPSINPMEGGLTQPGYKEGGKVKGYKK